MTSCTMPYSCPMWGAFAEHKHKLNKIITIQKCQKMFPPFVWKRITFDHNEFYLTCERAKTIDELRWEKTFGLEHTEPLFSDKGTMLV
jgi:hypothetical protein